MESIVSKFSSSKLILILGAGLFLLVVVFSPVTMSSNPFWLWKPYSSFTLDRILVYLNLWYFDWSYFRASLIRIFTLQLGKFRTRWLISILIQKCLAHLCFTIQTRLSIVLPHLHLFLLLIFTLEFSLLIGAAIIRDRSALYFINNASAIFVDTIVKACCWISHLFI